MAVVREDVPVVAVLGACATIENLEDHRGERHPVRVGVLRGFGGNQSPASDQIHIVPAHRTDVPAALSGQEHHHEHVVERLG